jgi:hypothetical protein
MNSTCENFSFIRMQAALREEIINKQNKNKTPWLLARKRTGPTERPPLVGEAIAKFCC